LAYEGASNKGLKVTAFITGTFITCYIFLVARVMNSRRWRWVGHAERWGRRDMHARIRGGKSEGRGGPRNRWGIILIIDVKINYAVRT
jgi:hypothetical protein